MILSVDFGHNSIKASSDQTKELIFPKIIANEVKNIELPDFAEVNPLEMIRVEYDNEEYMLGDLAREQSDIAHSSSHEDDLLTSETKICVLTAIALLVDNTNDVQLATNIPVSQYDYKAKDFKEFLGQDEVYTIKVYDHNKRRYKTKRFQLTDIIVKPQGFYSLMDYLLDNNGEIKLDRKDEASKLNMVIDIGYFSTDIYIVNRLKEKKFPPTTTIAGMSKVYNRIGKKLKLDHGIIKKDFELTPFIENKSIKGIGITNLIEREYERLFDIIYSDIQNNIPFFSDIDNILLVGGGAKPMQKFFNNIGINIITIDKPQFSNALGGLKYGKRQFKEISSQRD